MHKKSITLGAKLIKLRDKKNISLQKLADDLQLSKTAISKWEADKAKPKMDNLNKLCNYYEIDVNELLKENDKENISFKNAKFKGSSYVFNPNNSTINYNLPPEILTLLLENQKNITQSDAQQNELLQSLLVKKVNVFV